MDTIAAIATPRGQGGIGIVRMSGPAALAILQAVFQPHSPKFATFKPWRLHHGQIRDAKEQALDDCLAVFMPGPNSYSGEDIAEIHCHGGSFIVESILALLLTKGARQAEKGEFTRRAFLNGRMDISQAEAVAELIAAPSKEALRYGLNRLEGALSRRVKNLQESLNQIRALASVAVDFPDDEVEALSRQDFLQAVSRLNEDIKALLKNARRAQTMQFGANIILAGPVNAGKSSLFNALAGQCRALVSDLPGTTRDFLEVDLDFDGLPVKLLDTAGLRPENAETDAIEKAGIAKSLQLLAEADLVLYIIDGANPPPEPVDEAITASIGKRAHLMVWNKCDIQTPPALEAEKYCVVSARSGENLDELVDKARQLILHESVADDNGLAPNARQGYALELASQELTELEKEINAGLTWDCCLTRLDAAATELASIIKIESSSERLDRIFSQFCIGK